MAEWWERLGLAGWSAPGLPENAYGKAMARSDVVLVQQEIATFGALGAPAGLGLLLAAPTIATHGTQEQIDLYVRDIVTGQKAWCQLFSEPQAGSDLAGLQTRAVKDGDEWIINGQKVWTSGGQYADLGMLLARTDPDVPKHQGISYFAFDMLQHGVDVRPLKEMTGHALFNEVFITDARVADSALIGGLNNGWAAANTTLMNERAGLGSGGGNAAGGGLAQPGTVMGMLSRRVGDLVAPKPDAAGGKQEVRRRPAARSAPCAVAPACSSAWPSRVVCNRDAGIRQDLARLYTLGELGRFNGLRVKAAKEQGQRHPGHAQRGQALHEPDRPPHPRPRACASRARPACSTPTTATTRRRSSTPPGDPFAGGITEMALFAQAPPIYGGTDQVQRNIIGERVLGLPKEPNNDRVTPFSELPKNA